MNSKNLKKIPEQNNRPGIAQRYCLIKSKSAAAPMIAKEIEPSKLTTKSALTDNSLNTIRSRSSRIFLRVCTTNLLINQGLFPHRQVRVESRVFHPSRNLEVLISGGAYASKRSNSNKEIAGNSTRLLQRKMPEQNNRPGIAQRYCLIKSKSAAAPMIAKEIEPSKLTTKSALTDNSLNTIRSRSSRVVLSVGTTNLLINQGLFPHRQVRVESRVFLPSRNLEVLISGGAYASERSNSNKEIAGNSTFGSTVISSWTVAVLRGQNKHPYRLSFLKRNPRRESFTGNDPICFKQARKSLEDRQVPIILLCDSIRFQEAICLV